MFASLYPGRRPSGGTAGARRHVESMVSGTSATIDLDAALIAKARETIRERSIASARLSTYLGNRREARALAPWIPADALGPLGEQAFERTSKAPLREGIPGSLPAKATARSCCRR